MPGHSGMRLLLQLPPGLRWQAFQHASCSALRPSIRTFSNGRKLLQQRTPKPSLKTHPHRPKPVDFTASKAYLEQPLRESGKVLIYLSPNHSSLYTVSYFTSFMLLFGAYMAAELTLKNPKTEDGQPQIIIKRSWFLEKLLFLEIAFAAGIGTWFLLTPLNLVKSVALVKAAAPSPSGFLRTEPLVRLEIKRGLPFLKPDVLETSIGDISIVRTTHASSPQISMTSVPLDQAEQFTSGYFASKFAAPDKPKSTAWQAVQRELKRMTIRENMVYLRCEGRGKFKLDLQNAALLDRGRPLEMFLKRGEPPSSAVSSMLRKLVNR